MNEDDPTKNLHNEDAPTADPLPTPDTAPMLKQILEEVYKTRDVLLAEIREVKAEIREVKKDVRHISNKLDVITTRQVSTDADVLDLRERVEKLEGERV